MLLGRITLQMHLERNTPTGSDDGCRTFFPAHTNIGFTEMHDICMSDFIENFFTVHHLEKQIYEEAPHKFWSKHQFQ